MKKYLLNMHNKEKEKIHLSPILKRRFKAIVEKLSDYMCLFLFVCCSFNHAAITWIGLPPVFLCAIIEVLECSSL